jgi:cytoskeletal protein RodZ
MKDIGQEIQQARLAKGVALEEIASQTHIQLAHLQKIESGQFDFLPRPYVVAFIKTFAQHVGLSGEPLVKRWREHEQAEDEALRTQEQQLQQAAGKKESRKMIPLRPAETAAKPITIPYLKEIALGLGMILIMAALIYFVSRANDGQEQVERGGQSNNVPSGNSPGVQEIPFSQVSQEVAARTQAQEQVQQAPAAEALTLQAQFERQTRMRLIRDGADTSITVYRAGEVQTWNAREKFNLRISVAGAVSLTLDGKSLGKFGQAGQTEYLTITRNGVAEKFSVPPRPRKAPPRDSIVVRPLNDLGPRRRN